MNPTGATYMNPLLKAVSSILTLPTIEDNLKEGKVVDFYDLKDFLGDRLDIPNRKLCKSHIRSLADSIMAHKEVIVPIIVEAKGNNFEVRDGFHRLAALDIIDQTIKIIVKVKLKRIKTYENP